MQNAKDTFYLMLQQRLAALNPARTIVLRGQRRPGTLVDENELAAKSIFADTFRLAWSTVSIDRTSALPLVTLECAIRYVTDGTQQAGGMDRGRLLSALDAELAAALAADPQSTPKLDCSATDLGSAPAPMQTSIFWSAPVFGPLTATGERLERVATVTLYAYQEAGEL